MPKKKSKKRISRHISKKVVITTFAFIIALLAAANIQTTQSFGIKNQRAVLGENENRTSKNEQAEDQKQEAPQQPEIPKTSNVSGPSGSIKNASVTPKSTPVETVPEKETEAEGDRLIKSRVENNVTKIETEHGQLKIKYEIEQGRVVTKVENEKKQEVKLKSDELSEVENEVENELENEDVKISTAGGQLTITKNHVAATTEFPLTIDVGTNQLIVDTPAGRKTVTILPDQAVQNLITKNIVNKTGIETKEATTDAKIKTTGRAVKLKLRDNEVVYEIKGEKTHKLLGLIPVTTPVTVFVSAESGNEVAKEQSILTNIIDLLSS